MSCPTCGVPCPKDNPLCPNAFHYATKETVKRAARFLQETNPGMKLSACYERISKEHGFKDWNTFSAFLKSRK